MLKALPKFDLQDIVIEIMAWVFIASCVCCIVTFILFLNDKAIPDALITACFPALISPVTLCDYDNDYVD